MRFFSFFYSYNLWYKDAAKIKRKNRIIIALKPLLLICADDLMMINVDYGNLCRLLEIVSVSFGVIRSHNDSSPSYCLSSPLFFSSSSSFCWCKSRFLWHLYLLYSELWLFLQCRVQFIRLLCQWFWLASYLARIFVISSLFLLLFFLFYWQHLFRLKTQLKIANWFFFYFSYEIFVNLRRKAIFFFHFYPFFASP